jgi:cytochrome c553
VTSSRVIFAKTAALLAAVFVCASQAALAADMEAGRRKAETCAACHGSTGNSTDPAIPSIAGQPAQFISTQLYFFREGNRKNPQMAALAANLKNADLNDLAAYYSAQKAAPPKELATEKIEAGKRLTQQYNCTACHGAALLGQQHIPRLAGQHAEYLRTQLRGFQAGTRFDMDGNMTSAARAMPATDIDALAEYLASLGSP